MNKLVFNSLCVGCVENKRRAKTTGWVVKPILRTTFNSRAQMDLIDMQTLIDGQFK